VLRAICAGREEKIKQQDYRQQDGQEIHLGEIKTKQHTRGTVEEEEKRSSAGHRRYSTLCNVRKKGISAKNHAAAKLPAKTQTVPFRGKGETMYGDGSAFVMKGHDSMTFGQGDTTAGKSRIERHPTNQTRRCLCSLEARSANTIKIKADTYSMRKKEYLKGEARREGTKKNYL